MKNKQAAAAVGPESEAARWPEKHEAIVSGEKS